jgi:hypothetical protein
MEQTDLIVRRRLVEHMRDLILRKAASARPPAPSARSPVHREPTVRLHHLFLSHDERRASAEAEARSLQSWLRDENVRPHDSRLDSRGDPLLVPRKLGPLTQTRLATRLGESFAAAVMAAERGRWTGPIPSPYGLHLVWVEEVTPGEGDLGPPEASAAQERERRERAELRKALDRLRGGVEVIRPGRSGGRTAAEP